MADRAPFRPDVFLSYAREDEARARDLAAELGHRGLSVFWDREVPPGQTWHSHIGQALSDAKCVMVAWSRHSIISDWVVEEASEGRRRRVLVPVLLEAVQPPFGFGGIQAANLIDWRPGRVSPAFDGLVGAVQRILRGRAGSGTGAALAAPQFRLADPAPEMKPLIKPATPAPASRKRRQEPPRPPRGEAGVWSRRTALAMIAGFVAVAGAGGAAVFWERVQLEPTTSPSPVTEVEPRAQAPGAPDSKAGTEAALQPATLPSARRETAEPPNEMRDCAECPQMVLVPAGEFTMGSPPEEPGRQRDEGPQRNVAIQEPFWVGKYEATFAEWDACAAAGGCRHKPDDAGWGRDNRPLINVSWSDAKDYVGWLSQKTRKSYRLLSEAEWEYVARAGSTTAFWWGQDVGRFNANCAGCGSAWAGQAAPVGSFRPNEFGLYDTAGNVWEWGQDCYHNSYDGAPEDGSAWENGDDCSRVLRGGSWGSAPRVVRSADRNGSLPGYQSNVTGFRVARTAD